MTRDDIERMAKEAGVMEWGESVVPAMMDIEKFAALVAAAEREKVAAWMRSKSYATGHGDTIEDLLKELEWQVAEREREACAKVCEDYTDRYAGCEDEGHGYEIAAAIRARGEK